MDSMYEILMGLPLFKGVSYKRISEVIEHTHFHFLKYGPGDTIVGAGDACTHIKFVISGSVNMVVSNIHDRFRVSQTISAPDVLAPDFLFGRNTNYPCTITAIDTADILQIEKQEWLKILNTDPVFLLNFLNILSMNAQKAVEGVLALASGSLEERIAFWIISLTQRQATDIVLIARQRDLYAMFGVQRSSFIAVLDNLKQRGFIDYTPTEIRVNNRRDMITLLTGEAES